MTEKERTSLYFDLAQKALDGLAKIRMDKGMWVDSESEEQAKETQVFKVGECLRPFYLAAREDPDQFASLPLPANTLFSDTDYFLKQIGKNGFFPSPYSQIPNAIDQYTDLAAFTLDLCDLIYDYWEDNTARGKKLMESCETISQRALEFLLAPDNCLIDEKGCRWGGTNKFRRLRKTEEFFTDAYFTSVVVLALNDAIESPVLRLPPARKEEIKNRISLAGRWIVDRFDNQYITGDEGKANRKLLYTTWGVRALVQTNEVQDKNTRQRLKPIVNAYLDALREKEEFSYEQEYLNVLSEDVNQPLYYEDRSGLGGILLTLSHLPDLPDLERLLEETGYSLLVQRVMNGVMTLRNPSTGLWYNQNLILSIHSYLVEAFLKLHKSNHGLGSKLQLSGYMIRTAIKEVLTDEVVINSIQQAVYDRLLRLMEKAEEKRIVDESISSLNARPSNDTKDRYSRKLTRISRKK